MNCCTWLTIQHVVCSENGHPIFALPPLQIAARHRNITYSLKYEFVTLPLLKFNAHRYVMLTILDNIKFCSVPLLFVLKRDILNISTDLNTKNLRLSLQSFVIKKIDIALSEIFENEKQIT
jgi:hypothetical protein